jgi:hypothetical protein
MFKPCGAVVVCGRVPDGEVTKFPRHTARTGNPRESRFGGGAGIVAPRVFEMTIIVITFAVQ